MLHTWDSCPIQSNECDTLGVGFGWGAPSLSATVQPSPPFSATGRSWQSLLTKGEVCQTRWPPLEQLTATLPSGENAQPRTGWEWRWRNENEPTRYTQPRLKLFTPKLKTYIRPTLKDECITEVVQIGSMIIFHLSFWVGYEKSSSPYCVM